MVDPAAAMPEAGAPTAPPGLWVPVASTADLGPAPLAVRAFGVDLVVWRDEAGPHALVDRCPHRGARLSLGRCADGGLQCGYHGWIFAGDGHCLKVPSQPDFSPPEGHRAQAWRARLRHGLAWVSVAAEDSSLPSLDALPSRRVSSGPFDVATSAPRVVENFLDVAHFEFVHPGSLGEVGQPPPEAFDVSLTADGRPCVHSLSVWQPRPTAAAVAGQRVDYRYEVLGPYSALLVKRALQGEIADAYALFVLPVDETASRVWFVQATDDITTPDASLRDFQAGVFAQDRPVIESQRPQRLPLARTAERHCAADRLTIAYRDWLRASGVRYGTC